MLSWFKPLFLRQPSSLSPPQVQKLFYQYLKEGNAQKMRHLLPFMEWEKCSGLDFIEIGDDIQWAWEINSSRYKKRKSQHHQEFVNDLAKLMPPRFHEKFLRLALEHKSMLFIKALAPLVQTMDKAYLEYTVSTCNFKREGYPIFLEYMADKFLPEDVGVWGLMHDVPALYDYSLEKVSPQALREHMISQENSIPYDQLANSFTYQRFLQQYTKKERDNIAQELGERDKKRTQRKM